MLFQRRWCWACDGGLVGEPALPALRDRACRLALVAACLMRLVVVLGRKRPNQVAVVETPRGTLLLLVMARAVRVVRRCGSGSLLHFGSRCVVKGIQVMVELAEDRAHKLVTGRVKRGEEVKVEVFRIAFACLTGRRLVRALFLGIGGD